jgi:hypothetical protein
VDMNVRDRPALGASKAALKLVCRWVFVAQDTRHCHVQISNTDAPTQKQDHRNSIYH